MPIPPIAPYELPDLGTLPARRVGWSLDPRRAVLLIHDMQEYFVDAFQGAPMPEVIANIRTVREACDRMGVPTVFSAQPARQQSADRGLLTDRWGAGIMTDSEAAIIAPLRARTGDIEVVKWRYSAFVRTDFHQLLDRLGRDQLIITGIYAHIGCQLTAADAFMRDVQPFFAADAVADFSAAAHRGAIDYVHNICGTSLTTDEIVKDLSEHG